MEKAVSRVCRRPIGLFVARVDFAKHARKVAIVCTAVKDLVGIVGAEDQGTNQNKFMHLSTQRLTSVPGAADDTHSPLPIRKCDR